MSNISSDELPTVSDDRLLERINEAIERERQNLPDKASAVTITTLELCRRMLSTRSSHHSGEGEGWVAWPGGNRADDYPPGVSAWDEVEYRLRNGEEAERTASSLFWHHTGDADDIIAYRIVQPPNPQNSAET